MRRGGAGERREHREWEPGGAGSREGEARRHVTEPSTTRSTGRRHPRLRIIGPGLALLALSGCTLTPASDHGDQIRSAYNLTFVFAAVIFAVVTGMILWASIRFRRKPGDDTLPKQVHGNTTVEIVWTVIPSIIVLVLFVVSATTLNKVDAATAPPGTMRINITAFQWQWKFTYPDLKDKNGTPLSIQGQTGLPGQGLQEPTLVLELNRPVHFYEESADVIHSFFIPVFLFKRDVVPGLHNNFILTPNRTGTFQGKCAELCGLLHSEMLFWVKIVPKDQFDAWVAQALAKQGSTSGATCTQPQNGTVTVSAVPTIKFDTTCVQVPASQPVKVVFDNKDPGLPHNFDIYKDSNYTQHLAGANGPGQVITGPTGTATYDVPALPAGTYYFRCDIHPTQMQGRFVVK